MLSELVLSLALLGGIRDHLGDEGLHEAASTTLADMDIHTKDDLELFFENHPQVFREMLDVNQDGKIDVYELAVLEIEGADVAKFQLSDQEAIVLADGAVREDGELETDYVDEAHFKNWFVDTVWNALVLDADNNADGALSDEEWAAFCESELELLDELQAEASSGAVGSAVEKRAEKGSAFDVPLPENAVEALVAAGSVFSQVAQANSSRLVNGPARRRRLLIFSTSLFLLAKWVIVGTVVGVSYGVRQG